MRDPNQTKELVKKAFMDIVDFVSTKSFQVLVEELYSRPSEERRRFVFDVLLSPDELKARDITVPDGLTIQRSSFEDNRPTLFCVTKLLPSGCVWDKVTATFDEPMS